MHRVNRGNHPVNKTAADTEQRTPASGTFRGHYRNSKQITLRHAVARWRSRPRPLYWAFVCPLWVESGRAPISAIGQKRTFIESLHRLAAERIMGLNAQGGRLTSPLAPAVPMA